MCPLCLEKNSSRYLTEENRAYLLCKTCDLVYVPSTYFISQKDEKAKYDNHQNSPQNQGYKDFLNRLIKPLSKELFPNSYGLDFGSGPGPTLSVIMQEQGHKMEIYDYFYNDDKTVFEKEYDFITTTEVIEHLYQPLQEIQRLWSCLKPDGVLGIMTAFRPNIDEFSDWYYKRDLTHIRFFTKKSFEWLAKKLEAKLYIPQSGVVILKKEIL
jgi:hypothetical protein